MRVCTDGLGYEYNRKMKTASWLSKMFEKGKEPAHYEEPPNRSEKITRKGEE